MEHKIITGGEQYLPFARSRIKALRATGQLYATQWFVLPDGEVWVEIKPGHDYIRLTGGSFNVLSGITRGGTIVDLPVPPGSSAAPKKALREYMPTAQAWNYVLKKAGTTSPSAFHDERRLAIEAHADLGVSGSQYSDVCPSMYSGRITEVVQFILGYAKTGSEPIQLRYDFRWTRCHGIVTGADGNFWLLEISSTNGVIAMRLPLLAKSAKYSSSNQDVLSVTATTYGGLPSGGVFPVDLAEAIADGSVLQMLTPAEMSTFYDKSAYSTALGWSFKHDGSEAHNTCYETVSGVCTGYHYKLEISIGALVPAEDLEPGDPIAPASAALTEVENGLIHGDSRFKFWEPTTGQFALTPYIAWPDPLPTSEMLETPIFVCHIDDALEVVRHVSQVLETSSFTSPYYYLHDQNSGWNVFNPFTRVWDESYASFSRIDTFCRTPRHRGHHAAENYRHSDYAVTEWAQAYFGGNDFRFPRIAESTRTTKTAASAGCFAFGVRDGYVFKGMGVSAGTSGNFEETLYWNEDDGLGNTVAKGIAVGSTAEPNTPWPTLPDPPNTTEAVLMPESDELTVVTTDRVLDLTPTYLNVSAHNAAVALWFITGAQFHVRFSEYGESKQFIHSANMGTTTAVKSISPMLSNADQSDYRFSFVGYI